MTDPYWNHDVHHHPAALAAAPDGCRTALGAGCGHYVVVWDRPREGGSRAVTGAAFHGPAHGD
ncbi:hypothetical protein ACF08O_20605 [Streptomyces paradoxus]|uniref:hypothetical protein n=1 Tax=Streptomyces paradoxus TaxID=66375 RepID=UPI0036FCB807